MREGTKLIQAWGAHSAKETSTVVSVAKSVGTTLREFLYTDPDYVDNTGNRKVNEFTFFRQICEADPNVAGAIDFISQSMAAAYRGIGWRDDYDEDGNLVKEFTPSPGFAEAVEDLLVEIEFASMLKPILDGLSIEGNTFLRLWRAEEDKPGSPITKVEQIPASAITILDRATTNGEAEGGLITDRDIYLVNEAPVTSGESDQIASRTATSGTFVEPIKISSSDMLHFARNRVGNLYVDPLGRRTMNVWGISPLKSLSLFVKAKILLWLDYIRWFHAAVPRLDGSVDVSQYLSPENYIGASEEVQDQLEQAAETIITKFQKSLETVDNDPSSPTYGQTLPLETDYGLIHSSLIKLGFIGGTPIGSEVWQSIEACDRVLCSRLGVPMTFFGYESGSTYAVGYVTKSFMNTYGLSMVRGLELELREFIRREFMNRGIEFDREDVDRLVLVLDVQDPDQLEAMREDRKAELEVAERLATLAQNLFVNSVISHKEARQLLRDGVDYLKTLPKLSVDGYYTPPQPAQVSLAEAVSGHTSSLLERSEEGAEEAIKRTYEEGTKTLLQKTAEEVEAGNLDLEAESGGSE